MTQAPFACLAVLALAGSALAQDTPPPVPVAALRDAAARPLQLIQKSQGVWYKKGAACVSCHHQILPVFALSEARGRGVAFDTAFARDVEAKTFAHLRDFDEFLQGYNHIDVMDEGWRLFAAHAAGVPPNLTTSAMAQFLASAQRGDGSWRTMDARPPQSHSRFTATAVPARGVALYLPDAFKDEKQKVLERAREWLRKTEPQTTEDRTFQLLGLLWTGADDGARKQVAKQLLAEQRGDGGWAQVAGEKSDAYSTGEVLYALHRAAGVATTDPVYQKGLAFLVKTQAADGSWSVESRVHEILPVSPEYFTTGFPPDRANQFSSIAGTAWATAAILQAIPVQKDEPKGQPLPSFAPTVEKNEWARTALNGTAADLKAALAKGMKPDARTAHGTTALMLAARDPEKVKLLLDAGANPNDRTKSGFTALLVAARYHGNTEVVKLLLRSGAEVTAPTGVKVRNDASALFVAATSGDVGMVRSLLDAKADIEADMLVIGGIATSPLRAAVQRGDVAMLEVLLRAKADPNRPGNAKVAPLHLAVIANHAEAVKVLVANGAKVNLADAEGFTALHYAAYVNHHDTAVAEALVAAGADPNAKDKFGRTPRDVAKALNHAKVAVILDVPRPK